MGQIRLPRNARTINHTAKDYRASARTATEPNTIAQARTRMMKTLRLPRNARTAKMTKNSKKIAQARIGPFLFSLPSPTECCRCTKSAKNDLTQGLQQRRLRHVLGVQILQCPFQSFQTIGWLPRIRHNPNNLVTTGTIDLRGKHVVDNVPLVVDEVRSSNFFDKFSLARPGACEASLVMPVTCVLATHDVDRLEGSLKRFFQKTSSSKSGTLCFQVG